MSARAKSRSGRCATLDVRAGQASQAATYAVNGHRAARPICLYLKSLTPPRVTRDCADDGGDASGMHNGPPVVLPAPPPSCGRLGYRIWQTPPAQTREPQHWAPEVQKPSYQQQRESPVDAVYSQIAPVWGRRHWSVV
jgi:hypothetical protein